MEILRADNIVKKYAGHTALDNVSLQIPKQSIFGLLGPNGAGKTSLIRIINQITAPDSGEIYFDGEKLKPHHIAQIGYLPEERGLYKKMEVGEQVLYLAQLKGLSKSEATKKLKYWFKKFEITPWWNKKVEELSKGMAQKVQFIVTVLHEPKLLILDEPFSGFDPINANLIRDEINELKEQGTTVIFSTHNMGSVEELCDYIALIHHSKKILDGSVKDIRNAFKSNTYEIEFSGNLLGFTNALWTGFELTDVKTEGEMHKAKVKLLGGRKLNDLIHAVLPVVQIHSVHELIPNMNDIFISKVQNKIGVPLSNTEKANSFTE
ncbi:MAG: ABC transporter ATP-binding protein [Bacteroidetes bacterium]|nr:ABC transporter ATP-binding protein [Bacteroidota bacterium]HET6245781.1 ATP-binding cassette domain-containing protein [Bacteroidia bacterium]